MSNALHSLEFAPLLPWWAIIVISAGLFLPNFIAFQSKLRGRISRGCFALFFGLVLAQPVIIEVEQQPERDIALLIVDESESQWVTGRIEETRATAQTLISGPNAPTDVEWRRITLDQRKNISNGDGTHLFTTLQNALLDISKNRLAGIVIISDGIAHDSAHRDQLEKLPAPVHTILMGDPDLQDRRLIIERAPQFGLVGQGVDIQFRVDDGNGDGGASGYAIFYWSLGDEAEHSKRVRIGRQETITVRPDHRGQNIIKLRVEALENEVSLANNQHILSLSGVRDRLRVVLISGEPYQGERFWRATLKSDPAVDLVHFTILRLPTSQDFTPVQELSLIPFPSKQLFEDKLYDFDLVIFDRYALRGILQPDYLANLATYVESGGAVLVAVGPEYAQALSLAQTPLAHILPARPTGYILDQAFKPGLTEAGKRHPVTSALPRLWPAQDWGAWQRLIDVEGEQGDILMTGTDNRPLLILDRVGEGRVALLTSDQSWLWGKGIDGGGPHGEFVRRIAHWLMKEPDLEEEALHAVANGPDILITRQSMGAENSPVTLTSPNGQVTMIQLQKSTEGQSVGKATVDAPGLYRVSDDKNTTFIAAGTINPLELSELRPTPRELAPLSKATKGGIYWQRDGIPALRRVEKDSVKAGRNWIGLQRNNAGRAISVKQVPLLPAGLALILSLGLLAFGWYRESR